MSTNTNNTLLKSQLISLMQNFRGRKAGKSSAFLAEKLGISNVEFRELYSSCVKDQAAYLGSHPEHGYFMIQDQDDLDIAIRHIESRKYALEARQKALMNMAENMREVEIVNAKHYIEEARKEIRS